MLSLSYVKIAIIEAKKENITVTGDFKILNSSVTLHLDLRALFRRI